jgi:hypothetical protein
VSCGAENPADNRFCGQCGIQLQLELPHDADPARDAGIFNAIDGLPAVDSVNADGGVQPQNKYRIVVESAGPATRSGFLGISDVDSPGHDPDYDEEEKPPSHLGRNIAVSVVAVALALTALQWRSIRDYNLRRHGSASAPNGSIEAESPKSSAIATDSRTPALPSASAEGGAPQGVDSSSIEGNPTDHARAVQQSANSAPSAANSNASDDAVRPRSMGAPAANESQSAAAANRPDKFGAAHSAGSLSNSALPGAYEMKRAAQVSAEEARVAWLWNAVAKGNPQASVELASMYVQGKGVARNCEQAEILLRGAAEKGNEKAKLNLRQIHLQGGCAP